MDLAIYIGYSDILDIVIIWRNIPCPHHYHYIHYVLTVLGKYLPNITYFSTVDIVSITLFLGYKKI